MAITKEQLDGFSLACATCREHWEREPGTFPIMRVPLDDAEGLVALARRALAFDQFLEEQGAQVDAGLELALDEMREGFDDDEETQEAAATLDAFRALRTEKR